MTDPAATLSVWRALGEDNRPLATNGGPRISERLAARLGLAYLSFAVPEIDVTGKPHSPVVRLMRRSEFEAMRGSAPAMPSDPLVWVVEAQGSWRTPVASHPRKRGRTYPSGWWCLMPTQGRTMAGATGTRHYWERTPHSLHLHQRQHPRQCPRGSGIAMRNHHRGRAWKLGQATHTRYTSTAVFATLVSMGDSGWPIPC